MSQEKMEKDLTELENLKRRLFSKQHLSEDDQIIILRAVMREVGGYEQLMRLPITAYREIADSIAIERQREKEANEKAAHKIK